jgi:hypothetical protein
MAAIWGLIFIAFAGVCEYIGVTVPFYPRGSLKKAPSFQIRRTGLSKNRDRELGLLFLAGFADHLQRCNRKITGLGRVLGHAVFFGLIFYVFLRGVCFGI